MNRSQFSEIPKIKHNRTKFDMSKPLFGTCKSGYCIPVHYHECLPGDTWDEKLSGTIRSLTAKYPVMSKAYVDMCAVWIPKRLCMTKTKAFFGELEPFPWDEKDRPTMPKIYTPTGGWAVGSLADYLDYTPGVEIKTNRILNRELFNAYSLWWNEYERNQNLQAPIDIPSDDFEIVNGKNPNYSDKLQYVHTTAYGGNLAPACKKKDVFTECLPSPQRGELATFNLMQDIPITALDKEHDTTLDARIRLHEYNSNTNVWTNGVLAADENGFMSYTDPPAGIHTSGGAVFSNLWARGKDTPAVSIDALRNAILQQHLAEAMQRGGTRFYEILSYQYGVEDVNAQILEIPEIIAAQRTDLTMQQVVQTSANNGSGADIQALGDTAGLSNTQSRDFIHYSKSTTEFGYIMLIMMIRPQHTYCQGLRKALLKTEYTDYYNPILEGKSEEAVSQLEIFAADKPIEQDTFGFQEPWYDYRYEHSTAHGLMRPNVEGSLGKYWTYADIYTEAPTLSNEWIQEDPNNIDRTLVMTGKDQFLYVFYDEVSATRNMSPYGVPGVGTI